MQVYMTKPETSLNIPESRRYIGPKETGKRWSTRGIGRSKTKLMRWRERKGENTT